MMPSALLLLLFPFWLTLSNDSQKFIIISIDNIPFDMPQSLFYMVISDATF